MVHLHRKTVPAVPTPLLLTLIACFALACAGGRLTAPGEALAKAGAPSLPFPSALPRAASIAGALSQAGSDYLIELPNQNVTPGGERAVYTPHGPQIADAAYAIYRFDISGLSGPQSLVFDWTSAWAFQADPPCFWVGLSDWARDRWSWLPVQDVQQLLIGSIDPYINPSDGRCYTVLLFTGTEMADLRGISIGQDVEITKVLPLTVISGAPVIMSASVTGSAPLSYDWQFGPAATPSASTEISPTITPGAVGSYDCSLTVSNPLGSQTFNFTLQIGEAGPGWVHTYGSGGNNYPVAGALDAQGNLIILGNALKLTTISPEGSVLSCYSYNTGAPIDNDVGYGDLGLDSAGNIYISGCYDTSASEAVGVFLLKLNTNYELQWLKAWPGKPVARGCKLAIDSADNIWISASTLREGEARHNIAALKFSPAGELLVQQAWSTPETQWGLDVAVDSLDRAYLSGRIESGPTGIENDTCLLQYDSTGVLLRQRGFPDIFSADIYIPGDGSSVLLTLYTITATAVAASLDGSWDVVWSKQYKQGVANSVKRLLLTGDAIYMGGAFYAESTLDEPDSMLVKCDLSGNVEWARGWHRDDDYEVCLDLLPAPEGQLYLVGTATAADGAWRDLTAGLVVSGGVGAPGNLTGTTADLTFAVSDVSCDRYDSTYTWDVGGGSWDILAMRFLP